MRTTILLVVLAIPAMASAQEARYPVAEDRQPAVQQPTMPLAPQTPAEGVKRPGGWGSLASVLGSLIVVLGIFLIAVWALRRSALGSRGMLPQDVFEPLGRAPLGAHPQAHLIRWGSKLLLVAVSTNEARTLTEIAEPVEVERLARLCRQGRGQRPVEDADD